MYYWRDYTSVEIDRTDLWFFNMLFQQAWQSDCELLVQHYRTAILREAEREGEREGVGLIKLASIQFSLEIGCYDSCERKPLLIN